MICVIFFFSVHHCQNVLYVKMMFRWICKILVKKSINEESESAFRWECANQLIKYRVKCFQSRINIYICFHL